MILRLLYISSGVGWPFCWVDDAIAHAIKESDIDAHYLNFNGNYRQMSNFIDRHKPRAILTMNSTAVGTSFYSQLRSKGFHTVLWATDDPYDSDSSVARARLFSSIITVDKGCLQAYKSLGCKRVFYVPLGADTLNFYSQAVEDKYKSDICILGTGFDVRVKALDHMANYLNSKNTKIVGQRWELKSEELARRVIHGIVTPAEAAKYYNGAKIVLNIHRAFDCKYMDKNSRKLPAYSPNNRLFDIAACGAFQIISVRRDIGSYLINRKECGIAKDSNEIISLCQHYLNHPQEREQQAKMAQSKVLASHKMSDRIKIIQEILRV